MHQNCRLLLRNRQAQRYFGFIILKQKEYVFVQKKGCHLSSILNKCLCEVRINVFLTQVIFCFAQLYRKGVDMTFGISMLHIGRYEPILESGNDLYISVLLLPSTPDSGNTMSNIVSCSPDMLSSMGLRPGWSVLT